MTSNKEFEIIKNWTRCQFILRQMNWEVTLGERETFIIHNHERKYVTEFDGAKALKQFMENRWSEYRDAEKSGRKDPIVGN